MKSNYRLYVFVVLVITVANKFTCAEVVKEINADIDAQVIVIGAGPAGIAAATKLDQHNISVKLLEAEPRIGGRIHSIKFGDAYVDLGAEWCHGEEDNVVYQLMKDSGVLQHPNYTYSSFYTSDGQIVEKGLNDELFSIFEELYDTDGHRNTSEDDTVGSYFSQEYNYTIHERFTDTKSRDLAKLALPAMERYILSSEGAFSWYDPSAQSDYQDCKGDHTLTWNGLGFKTVLEKLMVNFNSTNKLLLNKEVKQIVQDGDIVKIVLTNGETFKAPHVVFTPSLGVLKDKHKDLFVPKLNENKAKAIETIGIGAVMKVIVYYPVRWWPENDFTGFAFVWTQEDRDSLLKQFAKGPQKSDKSWLLNFLGLFRVEQNPNVLSCWFTGEFVPQIETMDDAILIDGITFVINKFLGKLYKVPSRPEKFERTKWYTNSNFQGTYSFQTIASRKMKPSANAILGEPITNEAGVPRILFAGEATHPYFYSTVHGAIESGFREADRLIGSIKQ